ncbi:MAG: hypothetical protein LBC76_05865 [Treponema sp.]|jgi:hypothetical protein|nr:hypothetical protein [Treponema sp.]
MTAKKSFLLIIIISFSTLFSCEDEDLEFVTIKKSMLYNRDISKLNLNRDAVFEIKKGTRVKYPIERPYIVKDITTNGIVIITGAFTYKNIDYTINCADLIPVNTTDTFTPSFISDLNSPNRKTWVPSYYIDVLQSQDPNTVLLFEPYWVQKYNPHLWMHHDGHEPEWYENFLLFFPYYEFVISNSAIIYNEDTRFIIKNISKTANGYNVTVKFVWESWEKHIRDSFNWDIIKDKEYFNMILYVDGDYMDVYIEDMKHKLNTFVQVDQVFLNELKMFIEENTVNLFLK